MTRIDNYISQFEAGVQSRLKTLRQLFFKLNPDTKESIRYNMPAFSVGKHHLYFAAYKRHIGFYPVYGLPEIENEVSAYRAKGTKELRISSLPLDHFNLPNYGNISGTISRYWKEKT